MKGSAYLRDACRCPWPRRAGQAVVFLLLTLTALVFVLLFNIDLHRLIQRKNQTQNAGDAAALAAARWQGASLNLEGELNLMHVLALAARNPSAVEAITNMQARLCFTGPMTALFAAQIAAKNNRMYVDEDMTAFLREHAETVRTRYAASFGGALFFNEPWPGAWSQYADMLQRIADTGIAAGPDNARFFMDPAHGHTLMERAFYEAVEGSDWCWFHLYRRGLLEEYDSFRYWPPLPEIDPGTYADAEIFGLGLRPVTLPIKRLFAAEALAERLREAGFAADAAMLNVTNVTDPHETWYVYDPGIWSSWSSIRPDGEDAFPVIGPVRPEYDTAGADAVVRVNAEVGRITPGMEGRGKVLWTAAAKPFGYLESDNGRQRVDAASGFVLPAFRNTRLIPVDAASGSANSSSDVEWVRHVRSHLRTYMEIGPRASACRYCQALAVWENPAFRHEGSEWLSHNSHLCRIPSGGGGPGRGGGTRRGH